MNDETPKQVGMTMQRVTSAGLIIVRLLEGVADASPLLLMLLVTALAFWLVLSLVFGRDAPAASRAGKVLALLSDNWRALILLVLPLIYRPVKGLLERSNVNLPWLKGQKLGPPSQKGPAGRQNEEDEQE